MKEDLPRKGFTIDARAKEYLNDSELIFKLHNIKKSYLTLVELSNYPLLMKFMFDDLIEIPKLFGNFYLIIKGYYELWTFTSVKYFL